jgi:PAS domain S-box-containing protein
VSLFWRGADGKFQRIGATGDESPPVLQAEVLPLARLTRAEPYLKARHNQQPRVGWLEGRTPGQPWETYLGLPLGWMGPASQDSRQARLEGLLEIFWAAGHKPSESESGLLQAITHMVEMAFQNWRLHFRMLQERDFSQSVLETVSEGVITLDRQARVISLNRGAERILGSPREDLLGTRVDEAVCATVPVDWDLMLTQESGHKPFRVRVELPRLGRRDLHFFPSLPEKPKSEEEGPALVLVFRDITKQKELEELRSDFTATLSHELRTPLMSIKGYLKTLQHTKARTFEFEKVQEILTMINSQADHLQRLIQDLLDAARFNNETLEVAPRSTDLPALLREVVKSTSGGNVTIDLETPQECWVNCDPDQVVYVLGHLLSNALKFSKPGHHVRVSCQLQQPLAWVTVRDQGVGIPGDQLEHIFEMYHRVETGDRRVHYGVGLGLFLAKKIIEAHGGTIEVTSTPGKGATFRFSLRIVPKE